MAGKKVKSSVSTIRTEIRALSEAVWALREQVVLQSVAAAAANGQHSLAPAQEIAADLAGAGIRGTVVLRGAVRNEAASHEYRWDLEAGADTLLAADDALVTQILAAIGHRQRLAILKAVFNAPSTVADLVNSLDLGTTGAAYHHLKVLQAADLVTQESRGVFEIRPERVSAIFAILAGVESVVRTTVVETAPAGDVDADSKPESSKRKGRKSD